MVNYKKRAQEEIVGFIMIVVIVAIVGVILLGISIRQGDGVVEKESKEIYQFLESMMQYTTDCAVSYEPAYSSVDELIEECNSNSAVECVSGEKACDVMNREIVAILADSWLIGEDRPIEGYEFSAVYESGDIQENVIEVSDGVCEEGYRGSEYISPAFPGTIVSSLKLCY